MFGLINGGVGEGIGAIVGGAAAATLAATWYSVPLVSPAGAEGFSGAESTGGFSAGDDGYALAVEVGKEWGIYVAGLEGGKDAGDASKLAVEQAIENDMIYGNYLEVSALATATATATIGTTGLEPLGQGWYSKGLPFGRKIGKLAGMVAGLKVKTTNNSNTIYNNLDNIAWGSNKANWASNAAYYSSNTARWGSNKADWSSNQADWGSNTAHWSSNIARWSSNVADWASNTAKWSSNEAEWSSNTAVWGSNKAYWSSNTADWASNQARAASNKAYTDEYWINALSVVYTNSNVGIGTNTTNSKLDVDGAIHIRGESITPSLSQGIYLNWVNGTTKFINNRGVSGGDILFEIYNGLGLERTLMKLDNMGYVGIGKNNPSYTLDVEGTANMNFIKENGVLLTTKYALSNALFVQKERIDSVVSKNTLQDEKLVAHDERFVVVEEQLTALQTEVEAAQTTATAAEAAAEAAQATATAAETAAATAQTTATAAQGTATAAGTAAATANAAAIAAQATANTALAVGTGAAAGAATAAAAATAAGLGAGAAQGKANSAYDLANAANDNAQSAQSSANAAQGTTDSALGIASYSSNALSSYTLCNTYNTFSNWISPLSVYSSNALSNYALANTQSNYALSNTLSNYALSNDFFAFSNWISPISSSNRLWTNSNSNVYTYCNVGIGTSNPLYPFEVIGAANAFILRESNVLLSEKYALSNTLSNVLSNVLSNINSNITSLSNYLTPISLYGSNAHSNYTLLTTYNAYSNYITPKAQWSSNSLSNFSSSVSYTAFSNYITPKAEWSSNSLSNFSTSASYTTFSNWISPTKTTTTGSGITIQGNFGQFQTHSTYSNFNTTPAHWGWNYVQGNSNAPNTTSSQWYREVVSLGSDYAMRGTGGFRLEIAIPRFSPDTAGCHIRTVENGVIGGWTEIGIRPTNALSNYIGTFVSKSNNTTKICSNSNENIGLFIGSNQAFSISSNLKPSVQKQLTYVNTWNGTDTNTDGWTQSLDVDGGMSYYYSSNVSYFEGVAAAESNLMTLTKGGKLNVWKGGIYVAGSFPTYMTSFTYYAAGPASLGWTGAQNIDYSLRALNRILCSELNVTCDRKLKRDIVDVDATD